MKKPITSGDGLRPTGNEGKYRGKFCGTFYHAQNLPVNVTGGGIIGGLAFTAVSFRSEAKTRRVANLLTLTHNHRELWKVFYHNLDFSRILDAAADIKSLPVNQGEQVYVNALIQHLSSVFRAMQTDLTIKPEGVRRDVRAFFALPIPKTVWEKLKPFQDADFVAFVEDCLRTR